MNDSKATTIMEISDKHIKAVLVKRGYTEIRINILHNTYIIWGVNPTNNHDIKGWSRISYGHALLDFFKHKYNVQ